MIGNAIPPVFTYFAANALLELDKSKVEDVGELQGIPEFSSETPPATVPDREGATYPTKRRFRAALPGLRFKSGMRFELSNDTQQSPIKWHVSFYFGNSKNIHRLVVNERISTILDELARLGDINWPLAFHSARIANMLKKSDGDTIQAVWTHRSDIGVGPYKIVDALGEFAEDLKSQIADVLTDDMIDEFIEVLKFDAMGNAVRAFNERKLRENCPAILAGVIVMNSFNKAFRTEHNQQTFYPAAAA